MDEKYTSEKKSIWSKHRGWFLSVLVPFFLFFAAGAKFGWWFIERDVGRILRDTGRVVPDSDLLLSALLFGTILGLVGALIGALLFGLARFSFRLRNSKH